MNSFTCGLGKAACLPSRPQCRLSYCNSVAAEILVPKKLLLQRWPAKWDARTFSHLARSLKVSPIVIARCAKDFGLITDPEFFSFYRNRIKRESKKSGRPDFYRTQNPRLGRRFPLAVIAAAESGSISYSEAFDLTQLHGRTFDNLADKLRSAT